MSQYILYTYQFSPIISSDISLWPEAPYSITEVMENKQNYLEDFFHSDAFFYSKKIKYSHRVIYDYDGFIVFRLANQRSIHTENNFQVRTTVDYPSCVVIIDNRKDIQRIAIEDDYSAFSDTETVAKILQVSFNSFLKTHHLKITIQREFEKSEFWEIVDRYPSKLNMVRFKFSYPNLPRVVEAIDKLIASTSEMTNSKTTTFELSAPMDERLIINRDNEQVNSLVKASADSGNRITCKIKGFRSFISTGDTTKSIQIDSIETVLEGDIHSSASEKLASVLNSIYEL